MDRRLRPPFPAVDTTMAFNWKRAFTQVPGLDWDSQGQLKGPLHITDLASLKRFLDFVHIKYCLLKPYTENKSYPLVDARGLLPSFEVDLFEYKELPGFSMVALERPLDYFQEVFQFDRLHALVEPPEKKEHGPYCLLEDQTCHANRQTFRSRLPRRLQDDFLVEYQDIDIASLEAYPGLLRYLLEMERAHVMSLDDMNEFHLSGVYGSLPSDLDTELKRFGLRIKKFTPSDNELYERNRLFVYQFLMELHGFPIVSERRTSSALFARRLHKMGEKFMVRVLGQSDRTITSLFYHPEAKRYPRIEKIALVEVDPEQKEAIKYLKDNGYFVDRKKRVVILRVHYRQHTYNPNNVRQERALSVLRQEVIHPITGQTHTELNIIKDTTNMILRLNDIVRGEYSGAISYKRQEVVINTDTHDKRLKFLFAWLSKHQRRIIGYSDEFYSGVVKVLDSYLLSPDHYEVFNTMHDLYQEVWSKYSYIRQARKVKNLEDLQDRTFRGEKISYLAMLRIAVELMNELKFEIVNYFDQLVQTVLAIGDAMTSDRYLIRKYIEPPEDSLTDYGKEIRRLYGRIVALLDEFRSIKKQRVSRPGSSMQAIL